MNYNICVSSFLVISLTFLIYSIFMQQFWFYIIYTAMNNTVIVSRVFRRKNNLRQQLCTQGDIFFLVWRC